LPDCTRIQRPIVLQLQLKVAFTSCPAVMCTVYTVHSDHSGLSCILTAARTTSVTSI